MKYSSKQRGISLVNSLSRETYIINKREKGQKRIFKCKCCEKEYDFSDSDDYVGAVDQWEHFGGMCYACAKGYCHCKEGGWLKNSK